MQLFSATRYFEVHCSREFSQHLLNFPHMMLLSRTDINSSTRVAVLLHALFGFFFTLKIKKGVVGVSTSYTGHFGNKTCSSRIHILS